MEGLERSAIQTLDLGYNDLRGSDAATIAHFLEKSTTIKGLNLSNNSSMGSEGTTHLIRALKTNKSLKQLKCDDTNMDKEALEAALQRNNTSTKSDTISNLISDKLLDS